MESLVSIIIPAYNAERFISETINSVLNQTYTNWELIIINDGSTDKTLDIIQRFSANDNRISYITKNNSGVSDTRNKGIEAAKGEYIAFLDADDVWMQNNLEKKIEVLKKDPSVDFVYSNMMQADQNLQNATPAPAGKDENIFENLLLWNGEVIPGPCSNIVIKRKCVEAGIRFEPALTTIADQNFTVQLSEKFKGKLIKEALWIYRIIPGSMSKSLTVMEKDALNTYAIYKNKNYFRSITFRKKCFANMYLVLSGSWFKDGHDYTRGTKYLLKAFGSSPLYTSGILFNKLFKKKA
jgi:glycosyltransferase involved in cell wall biosynthesis